MHRVQGMVSMVFATTSFSTPLSLVLLSSGHHRIMVDLIDNHLTPLHNIHHLRFTATSKSPPLPPMHYQHLQITTSFGTTSLPPGLSQSSSAFFFFFFFFFFRFEFYWSFAVEGKCSNCCVEYHVIKPHSGLKRRKYDIYPKHHVTYVNMTGF